MTVELGWFLREIEMELTKAASDVLAERRRQIDTEGWTREHDDQHDEGDMAIAGACYAAKAAGRGLHSSNSVPSLWPWDADWWKPSDKRRNLVKAGALILAEIERMDRADLTPNAIYTAQPAALGGQ